MQALAFGAAAAAAAAAALVVGGGRAGLAPSAALRATAAVVCAVAVAVVGSARRRRKTLSNARRGLRFVPWRELNLASWKSSPILVVDTTHPSRECLTHHKMRRLPPAELRDDTTTGMVLNALRQRHSLLSSFTGVSVDHFDIDAFLSVFAACNPGIAEQFDPVVREAAIIGDFRELDLSSPGADCALKVCCWINTQERKRFNRPFEGGDEDKWPFFLGEARFAALLSGLKESPDAGRDVWGEEHDRVLADIELLRTQGRVRRHEDIGCCVVESPRALHYYALFSVTRGCDTVLSSHSGSCHEIEQKYTQFVNLETRDTPPRLEMKAFVEALNVLESRARPAGGDEPVWKGERVVDTGPLHRLQQAGETLTKSQRYGHPFERPAVPSRLPVDVVEELLLSFVRHGLAGAPRRRQWTWAQIHEHNDGIDWAAWKTQAIGGHC